MTLLDALKTLFEIGAASFIIWGIFNEKRLVAFERKILCAFRRKRLHVVKTDNVKKHIA